MIRTKNRLAKLRAGGSRPQQSVATSRLAAMSARIDSARCASLVRRPVFDRTLDVVAYEIVVGDGPVADIAFGGEEHSGFVVNSVVDLDVAAISDSKPLQMTVSASVLESGVLRHLQPEQVIVILGSGIDPSETVVAAVEGLRSAGFRIVLDDPATNPQLHSMLRLAHAVKLDFGQASEASFAKQIGVLKASGVELIADRIGSYEELRSATKLGFAEFQGSFLSRPDGFGKTRASSGQLAALELVTLLQDPDAEISDIAEVIRRNVSLSYRILKVVNSAQYSLPQPLGSIEEAVMLVGTRQIISWVGMMSMASLNTKPGELTRVAMVRARVCEMLAGRLGRPDVQRFYIVGLFSVIEALLDVPAEQALGGLPLSAEIVHAITAHGGIMGEVLAAVVAYEAGDWPHAHVFGLDAEDMATAFHTATVETDAAWSQIAERA